jgi:hypothetical protein
MQAAARTFFFCSTLGCGAAGWLGAWTRTQTFMPPSTIRVLPVLKLLSSLAR